MVVVTGTHLVLDPDFHRRALRFIDFPDTWLNTRMWTTSDDPNASVPWAEMDTPEKRAQVEFHRGHFRVGPLAVLLHPNAGLAHIESYVRDQEDRYATVIQKWVRGVLTRMKCGVHNPHCDTGKAFLLRVFDTWT
jgi:hypothetical protein